MTWTAYLEMNINYLKQRVDFLTARLEKLNKWLIGYDRGTTPHDHTFLFACTRCAIKTISAPHLHHHMLTAHHGQTGAGQENDRDCPELCAKVEILRL